MFISIRAKLLGGFAIILVLMGIVGWNGVSAALRISALQKEMYADELVPSNYLADVSIALYTRARDLRNVIIFNALSNDMTLRSNALAAMKADEAAIADGLSKFESSGSLSPEEKTALTKFKAAYKEYLTVTNDVAEASANSQSIAAVARLDAATDSVQKVVDAAGELRALSLMKAKLAADEGAQAASSATITSVMLGTVAMLIGLAIAFYLAKSIVGGLQILTRASQAIAEGDLQVSESDMAERDRLVARKDELGEMATAFRAQRLYVTEMAKVAEQIAEGEVVVDARPKSENDAFGKAFAQMGQNSLEARFPEIASEWHPTRNGDLTPGQVLSHSARLVWWSCPRNPSHEYQATVNNRAHGASCPFCAEQPAAGGGQDGREAYQEARAS